ncbi:MAG: response regulator transcription factor [Spirulinaceae cyanobacterium]
MSKILVIEDEPQIRDNIRQILEMSDFEVAIAQDGEQGLQLAHSEHPDLIVCDIMMPKLDGHATLAKLRQDEKTAKIPLIFLTAKSELADYNEGMALGANDYLVKPFEMLELLSVVEKNLAAS